MLEKIVAFFTNRHLLTNMLMISVFVGGVMFWQETEKEQMPNVTFPRVRVSASYSGASAEEMEYFVASPLESVLEGIEGVEDMNTSISAGSCSVIVDISPDVESFTETVNEIKTAVGRARLPDDMDNDPSVRYFKTSQMAVIDICFYNTNFIRLTPQTRDELQHYASSLADRLLTLPSVSEVNESGTLSRKVEIRLNPKSLAKYEIAMSDVVGALRKNNLRQPVGELPIKAEEESPKKTSKKESLRRQAFSMSSDVKLTVDSELKTKEEIENIIITGNFEGNAVYVKDIADVVALYDTPTSISKFNGYETVRLTVTKSAGKGILEAVDEIKEAVELFKNTSLSGKEIVVLTSDDESISIRDRLSFISANGALGFLIVLIVLFIFLDIKSGIWVAMGIPFSFCFTMITASLMGYTINNITLASVIIVMGMIVDDAIVVSENIGRMREAGTPAFEAAVKGTSYVFLPIVGSILTTCVAFVPILFFEGRMGLMVRHMPPIIILMLVASLIESILILPSHLHLSIPRPVRIVFSLGTILLIEKYFASKKDKKEKNEKTHAHWFYHVENAYEKILVITLRFKPILFAFFIGLLVSAGFLFKEKMSFVMFPREETTDLNLSGEVKFGTPKEKTEIAVREVEKVLNKYLGKEIEEYYTSIARGRRGMTGLEHSFSLNIKIVSKEKRDKSADELIAMWEEEFKELKGFSKLSFSKSRFGSSSGSVLEIAVLGNNEEERKKASLDLVSAMSTNSIFKEPEIGREFQDTEYRIHFDLALLARIGINPSDISTALRTISGGMKVFTHTIEEKEVDYIVTIKSNYKSSLKDILAIPVPNRAGYLVPLKQIIQIEKKTGPSSISRLNGKRVSMVYSDIAESEDATPLEVADYIEKEIFPMILPKYPTVTMSFRGEVDDSRKSGNTFLTAVIMVIVLIYMILALLFNSLDRPFIIMMIIPFGLVGIILAFIGHGMYNYGFFAALGALGLSGVIINDSIIMISKLDREFKDSIDFSRIAHEVASVSKTRLRAVVLTTLTTVAGLMPTAYGVFGYDSMLAEMMLAVSWGLIFGTVITLFLVPSIYTLLRELQHLFSIIGKKLSTLAFISFFLLVVCIPSFGKELSLSDYLKMSKQNGIRFQQLATEELSLKYEETLLYSPKDLILNVLYSLSGDNEATVNNSLRVGLSKIFSDTATALSLNYSLGTSSSSDSVANNIALSVSQDIVKNAFGRASGMEKENALLQTEVAKYEIEEAYEEYIASIIGLYYDWYETTISIKNAKQSLLRSKELLESVEKKYALKIADISDINRMKIQILQKESSIESLQRVWNNLYRQISLIISSEEKMEPIEPNIALMSDSRDFENIFSEFTSESRSMKIYSLLIEENKIASNLAFNAILPTVQLEAGVGVSPEKENFFDYSVGFSLNYPLTSFRTRASYQKTIISTEKILLEVHEAKNKYYTTLKDLYEHIKIQERNIERSRKKIELMETVVNERTRQYSNGKASLNDLINENNLLDSYKAELLSSRLLYEKTLIQWLKTIDNLIPVVSSILD